MSQSEIRGIVPELGHNHLPMFNLPETRSEQDKPKVRDKIGRERSADNLKNWTRGRFDPLSSASFYRVITHRRVSVRKLSTGVHIHTPVPQPGVIFLLHFNAMTNFF